MRHCTPLSPLRLLFVAVLLPAAASVLGAAVFGAAGLEPRTARAKDGKALDEYFQGKVVALDGNTVTLRYDFRQRDQEKDWEDRIPYRIVQRKDQGIRWFDEKLEIVGNAGARHKAEWMNEVLVTATFIPDMERDFGGYLQPVTETEDFATFTFVETFFHAFDNSAGGMNSIIKFGAQWREGDSTEEFIGFRYGPRKPPKKSPVKGQPIRASFGLQKKKLVFRIPEYELKGADRGKRLKRFYVGFYAIKGRLLLDNIEITGRLATDWLDRMKVDLRTTKPIGEQAGEGLDAETQALMERHKQGKSKATRSLLDLLKDESQPAAVQEAVVGCLASGPKQAVRYTLDLLYNPQERVREHGIAIIKGLLGKDYGYKPGASEKSRSKAIQKLNEELKKNPGLLEG